MGYFSETSYGEDGHWVSGDLTDSDTAGAVFNWMNIENGSIIIDRVIIDVTTAATGACTLDIGTTDTSAATSSDTLIDGVDVNAATGTFDNIEDGGTNGKSTKKLSTVKWITASKASGATAGLVGKWYVHYRKCRP